MRGTRATDAEPQLLTLNPSQRVLPISHEQPCLESCDILLLNHANRTGRQVTAWTPEDVHVYNPGEIGARLYPGATLRSDIPIVDTEIGTTYILILVGDVLNDN